MPNSRCYRSDMLLARQAKPVKFEGLAGRPAVLTARVHILREDKLDVQRQLKHVVGHERG